jgi:serine/threonine protein kinase
VGEKIGHYTILERLGWGALGDVYRARDTKIGRTVALFQPPAQLVADPARRARFVEDARIAATLNHPNIAALFDVVEQDGRCYLAYEFAAGPSLRQEMAGQRLGVRRSVDVAAQIADALAEGHARGILHGDLRPETVVVTPKGSTKILNFGMVPWTAGGSARSMAALSPGTLTPEEAVVAGYLSPEQALGGQADARSDLFTVGVILYAMLTGKHPFEEAAPAATVLNIVRSPAPSASAVNREVPRELDAIVGRVLSKEIEKRHESAAALASDLRGVSRGLDAGPGTVARTSPIPPDDERRSGVWWIAALGAAALAGWWLLG